MNTSNYPSLELCKKLTDIGFPISVHCWNIGGDMICHTIGNVRPDTLCPSVMEMLDKMPQSIDKGILQITHDCHDDGTGDLYWSVEYSNGQSWKLSRETCDDSRGGLPNAIAEMILWLVENGYINFNAS